MIRQKNKLFYGIVSSLLLLAMLAGCGTSAVKSANEQEPETQPALEVKDEEPEKQAVEESEEQPDEEPGVLDTEPPVISGAEDRIVRVGSNVLYKEGVTAYDETDGELKLLVDISQVNSSEPGIYPVTYSATDAAGNTTSVTVDFYFTLAETETISDEELLAVAQPIYDKIVREDMTTEEKARAIYGWVRSNFPYTHGSDKSSWQAAALTGFKRRTGDCFTYYSVSKALLDIAGIPNMQVTRIPRYEGDEHYWLLVNIDGDWFHFDTTPRVEAGAYCLKTDEFMLEHSENFDNCFDFDLTLYPRTPGRISDRFMIRFYPELFDENGKRLDGSVDGPREDTQGYLSPKKDTDEPGWDDPGGDDPGTGGTDDPGTGGNDDPGTGGTDDPGTGGNDDPGTGGTDDSGTGGGESGGTGEGGDSGSTGGETGEGA